MQLILLNNHVLSLPENSFPVNNFLPYFIYPSKNTITRALLLPYLPQQGIEVLIYDEFLSAQLEKLRSEILINKIIPNLLQIPLLQDELSALPLSRFCR